MNRLKPLIRALKNTGRSESYNCALSIDNKGDIIVLDYESNETSPFKMWIEMQDEPKDEIINDIEEELIDQLHEENSQYFDYLRGLEFDLLRQYRVNECGYEDDDDDEGCEAMFIRDQSEQGVRLENLVAELMQKRRKGLRNYSDKTKDKARKKLTEWLELCEYIPGISPASAMEEMLQTAYGDDLNYVDEFPEDTPQEIAAKAVERYPIVCSSSFQKNIVEDINNFETAEKLCGALMKELQKAFPSFYKTVKKYKTDYKESAYCVVKLKESHQFTSFDGDRIKTKMLCLFEEEIFVGRHFDPSNDVTYSARDYLWLIKQIPNMALGPVKYCYAD